MNPKLFLAIYIGGVAVSLMVADCIDAYRQGLNGPGARLDEVEMNGVVAVAVIWPIALTIFLVCLPVDQLELAFKRLGERAARRRGTKP